MRNKCLVGFFLIFTILNIIGITSMATNSYSSLQPRIYSSYGNSYNYTNSTSGRYLNITPNQSDLSAKATNVGSSVLNISRVLGTLFLLIFGGFILSIIPIIIACVRKHPKKVPIILISIFLGWTIIGWLAALIWACILPKEE